MQDIRRTIEEFHIDLRIVEENGQEKLLFKGGRREALANSETPGRRLSWLNHDKRKI